MDLQNIPKQPEWLSPESCSKLEYNVPLVGDGWDRKSQLFEPKTIITSTNKLLN